MSYKDKFGITDIFERPRAQGHETLSVSWDYDANQENREERIGVLLYVPYTPEHEHEHIAFGLEEAKILRDWLSDYIEDLELHGVKKVKNLHLGSDKDGDV